MPKVKYLIKCYELKKNIGKNSTQNLLKKSYTVTNPFTFSSYSHRTNAQYSKKKALADQSRLTLGTQS